jgi:hypothetical protein
MNFCSLAKWFVLLMALVLAGCATTKTDWSSRVGHYTYDQAVTEMGPPERYAKLTDGTRVADWMTWRGGTMSAPEPYFFQPGCYFGPATPMYSSTYLPSYYVRLTFGTNDQLKVFKEFAR